jgi:hypothetical protein
MTTVPVATVPVYDATHEGIGSLPAGRAAGYTTGTGIVPWTAADWRAHPGAVRICQDPGATDTTADILDVEAGAATIQDCPAWYRAASVNWATAARPGQRRPAIYCSLSNVTPLVNALVAAGITSGPGLWIANWNLTQAEATALVATGGGPFPVIGVQYGNRGAYDVSVFSVPWLTANSASLTEHPAASVAAPVATPATRKDTGMIIIKVTAPAGTPLWAGKTRTFLYAGPSAKAPDHVVSEQDQAALGAVLPTITVSWQQYQELGGV